MLSLVLRPLNHYICKHQRLLKDLIRKYSKKHNPPKHAEKTELQVCTISDCMVDPCKPEPSVVIIGAGMAGLSAAQRLVRCGISNFTILEATDRPGGRIHSCWLGDVIAEMGAQGIDGACVGNPVYNLAAQEGLLKPPLKRRDPSRGIYCTSDGRVVDSSVSMMAYHVYKQIEQEAESLFHMGCGREHGSLQNFLDEVIENTRLMMSSEQRCFIPRYFGFFEIYVRLRMHVCTFSIFNKGLRIQQELQKFPEDQRYDVSRIMYGLTHNLRNIIGDDLTNVSADNFGSGMRIPGGRVQLPLGYVGILSPLLRELPECSLKFGKPVGLIRWGAVQSRNKGPRAVVQCCDGEELSADYVIITVSLGVLKEHGEKMFCPALPANKIDAIKSLGYGYVDKVYMDYERPFWVWSDGTIRLAWSKDELAHRTDWTKGISTIEEVEGSKHVLCAYISGPEAVVMEHASDEEVAEGITKVLRQFTGDASLPYPSTVFRSKWGSDPYFCGSYSYMNLASNVGHQCDLSCPVPGTCDPVPPILLFAGEATCAGHYSTVHGARLSGIREAERVLQLTRKYGGPPPRDCA